MTSVILRTASRFLIVLMLVFSLFILVRGHNEPGGGFIGGLLAAGGFALFALANGTAASRDLLRIDPRTLLGIGILIALLSGCAALFAGEPFMTGLWRPHTLVGIGEVGTILLFDIGVYLVVMGTTLLILFTLDEGPST